jgi:hypothetical protein
MTIASQNSETNATGRFKELCIQMQSEVSKFGCDYQNWTSLERQALQLLDSGIYIDKLVMLPGICLSGSNLINRKLRALMSNQEWERCVKEEAFGIPDGTLRFLSSADIEWLAEQGLGPRLLRPSFSIIFRNDNMELLRILSEHSGASADDILIEALSVMSHTLPPLPNMAAALASALRNLTHPVQQRDALEAILEGAILLKDMRLISAILSLGCSMTKGWTPEEWTENPHLLNLLNRLSSHHGLLYLVTMEPNTKSVLERADPGPFHGLTPDMMQSFS